MFFWLILLVVPAFIFYLRRLWTSWSHPASRIRVPIAPNRWPILGHAHYFVNLLKPEDKYKAYVRLLRSFDGPICQVYLGPKPIVLVKSARLIEALFNHPSAVQKDEFFYRLPRKVTGCGVFSREGEAWKVLRKPAVHMTQPKNIPNFLENNLEAVYEAVKQMEKEVDQGPFDIAPYALFVSMKFFLEKSQNIQTDSYPGGIHALNEELNTGVEDIFQAVWSPWAILGLDWTTVDPLRKRLTRFSQFVTDQRRKVLKDNKMDYTKDDPEIYIDVILKVGESEGKNDADTALLFSDFWVAAVDTQSTVVATALAFLGIYQDCQQKAYEELLDIFGTSERFATEEDFKRMKYLEMCIKESLRFCSVFGLSRYVDTDIEIDGYFLPEGTTLIYDFLQVTKNPQYWERPYEFYPEHFQGEGAANRPKGAFTPFALGKRACPGQLYAMTTMKSSLSAILRTYHVTSDLKPSEMKFKILLMRVPINSFIRIKRRKPLHEEQE